MQPLRAGADRLARSIADGGGEALRQAGVPGVTGVHSTCKVRHEKQVEVGEVIGDVLGRQHQVGRQVAIARHRQSLGVGQRIGRRHRLRDRAYATDTRRDHQRIARVLAGQDLLEAAVQRRIHIGRSDPAVVDVQRHLQVTLDAVERADNDASSGVAHRYLVLLTLGAIRA